MFLALILGKSFILYTTTLDELIGAMLALTNKEEKENVFYYFSHYFIPFEVNYSPMENYYLALIFIIQKL